MSEVPPNPPRRSVFAVWRWPRWMWIVIVPLMLTAYFLSAGVILFLEEIEHRNGVAPGLAFPVGITFYPAFLAAENSEFLDSILTWEIDTLLWFYASWDVYDDTLS